MPTLTVQEILGKVIPSFKKSFPILSRMGVDFQRDALTLNKTYTAHIPTLPSVSTYDATTGYAYGAQTARSLLSDVDILVDTHKHVPIKWEHLQAIKDDSANDAETIGNAGYVLAKAMIDSVLAKVGSQNFSNGLTYTAGNSDADMLTEATGQLNTQGAESRGRVMIVNTAVANTLSGDARMTSSDYGGVVVGGDGYRTWTNRHGFAMIQEYPDMPTNNGTALTSVSAANSGDVFTKAAHGLVDGQRVALASFTNSAIADGYYYVISKTTNTFQVSTTVGGSAAAVAADGSGTATVTENISSFAFDRRAFAILAGPPKDFNSMGAPNGIPDTMGYTPLTMDGVTMAGIGWQATGTGDKYFFAASGHR